MYRFDDVFEKQLSHWWQSELVTRYAQVAQGDAYFSSSSRNAYYPRRPVYNWRRVQSACAHLQLNVLDCICIRDFAPNVSTIDGFINKNILSLGRIIT